MIVEGNGEVERLEGIRGEVDRSLRMRIDILDLEIQVLRGQLDVGKNFSGWEKSESLTFHIIGRASWGSVLFRGYTEYEFKGKGRLANKIAFVQSMIGRKRYKRNYKEDISVWLILKGLDGKEVAISISEPCWREYCQL
jgi:hypothetical protein